MAADTLKDFSGDYNEDDFRLAAGELNLLANAAHSPLTTEATEEEQEGVAVEGGLAVAVRGVGHYGPVRREQRYMAQRAVLGDYAVFGRPLPPGVYGTSTPPAGPDYFLQ